MDSFFRKYMASFVASDNNRTAPQNSIFAEDQDIYQSLGQFSGCFSHLSKISESELSTQKNKKNLMKNEILFCFNLNNSLIIFINILIYTFNKLQLL